MNSSGGWHADPYKRFEHRYWDGSRWTEHVSQGGLPSIDPPVASPVEAPLSSPTPPSVSRPSTLAAVDRRGPSNANWTDATIDGARLLVERSDKGALTGRTGLIGDSEQVERYVVDQIAADFVTDSFGPGDFLEIIEPIFRCTDMPLSTPIRTRQRSVIDPEISATIVPGVLTPPIAMLPWMTAGTEPSRSTSTLAPWLRLLARPTAPPRAGIETRTTWLHPETTDSVHDDTGKHRRFPVRGVRQAGGQLLVYDDRIVLLARYDIDTRQGVWHSGHYFTYEFTVLKSTITEMQLIARYSKTRPLPAAARAEFDARGHGRLDNLDLTIQFMTGWGSAYINVTLPAGMANEEASIAFARWVLADIAHHRVNDLTDELTAEQRQWIVDRAAHFPPGQMYRPDVIKEIRSTVHLPLLCARNFGVPLSSAVLD